MINLKKTLNPKNISPSSAELFYRSILNQISTAQITFWQSNFKADLKPKDLFNDRNIFAAITNQVTEHNPTPCCLQVPARERLHRKKINI